jgi:hypothetical protein
MSATDPRNRAENPPQTDVGPEQVPEGGSCTCENGPTALLALRSAALDRLAVENERLRAKVARVEDVVAMFDRDCTRYLDDYGQHLAGGAVESCADFLRAALADPDGGDRG